MRGESDATEGLPRRLRNPPMLSLPATGIQEKPGYSWTQTCVPSGAQEYNHGE